MSIWKISALSSAIMMIGYATSAQAQLAQNLSVDVRSWSMGNAVTADPPGVNAVHFNPAALTKTEGLQMDLQGVAVDFGIEREYSVPPGYEVFGYSDDPLVCNDDPGNPSKICTDFKDTVTSRVEYPTIYAPVIKKFIDFGEGSPLVAPLIGAAYKAPGSKFAYATAMYAPLLAGFGAENGNAGNFMGQQVAIERLTYLSPTIAYEVNDTTSVGLSVGMSYQALAMKTDLRFPNEMLGLLRMVDEDICGPLKGDGNIITDVLFLGLCNAETTISPFDKVGQIQLQAEQSLAPSFNLGLLWEPNDKFGFGMVYQSPSKMRLKGKYTLNNADGMRELVRGLNSSPTGQIVASILDFPTNIPETESGLLSMDLEHPAHVQAGIKYKILPKLQVNFDVGWTDFEAWDSFKFEFDRAISLLKVAKLLSNDVTTTSLSLPLKFKSSWNWGIGAEYTVNDRLKLRAGYEPRSSAIPNSQRNPMIPFTNAELYGVGLGFKLSPHSEIDLSAAILHNKDNIPAGTSDLANSTGVDNLILNPYAGLDVSTETTLTFLGAAYRKRW